MGSIDQKYLEQIVQDFNKTINGGKEQEVTPSSSLVIFDDPIDIPGSELEEMTTKVFQNTPQNKDSWDDAEVSDEFLADVDIIYKDVDSGSQTKIKSWTFILIATFIQLILILGERPFIFWEMIMFNNIFQEVREENFWIAE